MCSLCPRFYFQLASSGPYGPLLARSGSPKKNIFPKGPEVQKDINLQIEQKVQAPLNISKRLSWFHRSAQQSATVNILQQCILKLDLCRRKWCYAAGNNLMSVWTIYRAVLFKWELRFCISQTAGGISKCLQNQIDFLVMFLLLVFPAIPQFIAHF